MENHLFKLAILASAAILSSGGSGDKDVLSDLPSAISHVLGDFAAPIKHVTVTFLDAADPARVAVGSRLAKVEGNVYLRLTSPATEAAMAAADAVFGAPPPSDVTLVVGGCVETLQHFLLEDNAHLYRRASRVFLTGASVCRGNLSELTRQLVSEMSTRPYKLWTMFREENGNSSGIKVGCSDFNVRAVSYWNEETEPRFFSFGKLPLSVPSMGETELASNRNIFLRAVTVGGRLALEWDSYLERNGPGSELVMREGLSKEIWDYIMGHAGIMEVYRDPAETWGSATDLKGMTGVLARDEADVAVTIMAQCCGREAIFDYTMPIEFRRFWIFFRQPDLARDILFDQFSLTLWLTILGTVLALQLVMWLISLFNVRVRRLPPCREYGFPDVISWSLSFLSQQGYEKDPSTASKRLLFLTGFAFSMLLFTAFSANIIAAFARARSLDSFAALLDHANIRTVVSFFPYFQHEMRASANPEVVRMMAQYDRNYQGGRLPCDPEEDGIRCDYQIANDIGFGRDSSMSFGGPDDYTFDKYSFAFMANRFYSCQLTYFQIPMGVQLMSYGVRKYAPYKKDIDLAILRLRETGLIRKMYHDFYPHPPDCSDFKESYKQVSIFYIYSAYLVLLGGYALAIAIVWAELVYASYTQKDSKVSTPRRENLALESSISSKPSPMDFQPSESYSPNLVPILYPHQHVL